MSGLKCLPKRRDSPSLGYNFGAELSELKRLGLRGRNTDFMHAVPKTRHGEEVYIVRVAECKAKSSNAGFVIFSGKLYKQCQMFMEVRPASECKEMFVDLEGKPLDSGKLFIWCEKFWNKWRFVSNLEAKKFGFTKVRKSAHTEHAGKHGFGDIVFSLGAGHR